MDFSKLRNFGIAAHIDAGKTTVSERMLVHAGIEHRVGAVDEGTSVMDWMTEERERGITITSAATRLPWEGHELNLIDTPGHVDFTVEVERCMRVLDGAILVLDAVVGVQAQSETVWRQMTRHRVPAIAFVNKCDRPGANFLAAVASLRERLGAPGIPVQYPVFEEGEIVAIVDLCEFTAFDVRARDGVVEPMEVPAEVRDEAGVLRSELIDALADEDEALFERVLADEEPTAEELRAALRQRVMARTLVPALCGAALRNIGVRPLLDAVVALLPSPLDVPAVEGRALKDSSKISLVSDPTGPPCALCFKLHAGPHGDLTFARIYSGTITPGMNLFNPRSKSRERVARVLRIHADSQESLEQAQAGDIVAFTGLKHTGTGDTLCSEGAALSLEALTFPEPVIQMVVEPESSAERVKLRAALERLAHEDPTFHVREDESGQWTVGGMGELHLEVALHRLEAEFKLTPRVGQPRVAYREAVITPGVGRGEVDRVVAGKEAHAVVRLELEPDPGAVNPRVEFALDPPLSETSCEAVRQAVIQEAQVGPRFGYPMVSAAVRVVEARARQGQESEQAFVQAAVAALREAMPADGVQLEEPLMEFEIQSPAEFSSGIISDLNGRKALLAEVTAEGESRLIRGSVPLQAMFGYSTTIRSLSQGRASCSMSPVGYRAVPEDELAARGLVWI
ncbi:MAG: elongation factor G [bacterium]|jgi:elongation factor G|nr:elongation factor G [Planctomycetota bacterium]HIL51344.1 elongation factor G [Planctomycetota bacterium]